MTSFRLTSASFLRHLVRLPGWTDNPRLQHTLEQLQAAAFLVAPRAGSILAINGRAAALTEWARSELMARSLAEVVAAPQAAEALEHFYHLEPGRVRQLQAVVLRTRSGRSVSVDLRLSAFEDAERGETLVLAIATPAEERLAQARDAVFQNQVLEGMDDLLSLQTGATMDSFHLAIDRIRLMLSADAAGFYRYNKDSPGFSLWHAEGAPADFPRALGPSEVYHLLSPLRWNSTQRYDSFLYQAMRAAGWSTMMAHPAGQPRDVVGALFIAYRPGNPPAAQTPVPLRLAAHHLYCLLEQIEHEAKLANAKQLATRLSTHFSTLNSQIEEGVVLINREGLIDEINVAAARLLGYRSEDVTGLPYGDVLISDGPLLEAIQRDLRGEPEGAESRPRRRLEDGVVQARLHHRRGETLPVVARLRPLPPPEGGCAVTFRDVSETRASEVHREHLDQLAYVGQSTQSFAHEVRGPLNNIAMGVQYLAARLPPDETLQVALAKIQAECVRLSNLMNDMLSWAKPVDPKFEPTDLVALLERLANRWSVKIAQRNVRLNFQAEAGWPLIPADSRLIEQVFVNLLDNALQAMPAGGHLAITLKTGGHGTPDEYVEVSVADSGPGIPDEAQRSIFDPYFTTKPNGTGLGLAICKRLVTIHRGAIAVDSFPGAGTIFTVRLPRYTAVNPEAQASMEDN